MKSYITPLLLVFFPITVANAQCPGPTTLNTQQKVDDFATDYPGCINLTSKLTIKGNNITNLDGLSVIETTENSIEILDNPMLASLGGLTNLTSIGVEFKIDNNDALTDLTGLEDLAFLGGHFSIEGNLLLTTLDGLGPIPTLGSYLNIAFNPVLTDITALNSLTEVGPAYFNAFLWIHNNNSLPAINGLDLITETGSFFSLGSNPAMTTVNGLNGLTTVNGNFEITGNGVLSDLNGFTSLTTVDGVFNIDNNSVLTNIDEFDNLTTIVGSVTIASNNLLSDCVSDGICAKIAPPGNQAAIANNATGCDTELEVETACAAAPVELSFFRGKYEHEEVFLSWQTASEENNTYFEVQHSLNGKNFEPLGRVTGNGTTLTLSDYQFRDSKPAVGFNYYRLKQMDFDGKFQYSNILSIMVKDADAVEIFPNPTKGPVCLKGEVDGVRGGRVTDLAGRVVLEKDLTESGLIDLSEQPNGVYLLEIQTNNSRAVKRIVKE